MKSTAIAALVALGALWPAAPAGSAVPANHQPRLDALLAQTSAALGCAGGSAVHGLALQATVTVAGIPGTEMEWDDLRTGANAVYDDAGPLSGGNGFDGTRVWNEDAKGIVWDDGSPGELIRSRQEAYVRSHAFCLPNRGGARVALGASRSEDGRRYDVVTVTLPATPPFDLWLDATSHLPARMTRTIGRNALQTQWSDYRLVAGLRVPFRYDVKTPAGDVEGTVTQALANDPAVAAHVVPPVSHPSDFTIANGSSTTIPFELAENHVYLDATIDGKGPFHLIFDTGGTNVLDVDVAKELGLTTAGSVQAGGVGASSVQAHFATVASLGIGAATLTRQIFAVAPVHHGFGVSGGRPVDGLIGFEVLERFVTTFDYERRQVVLRLPDAPASPSPASPEATSPAPAAAIPFTFDGTTPAIACAIDTIAGTCTIDTGSRDSFDLHTPFITAHPALVPATLTQVGVGGFGFGGPLVNRLGRTSLALGPFTLDGTITGFTAQDVGAFADPFVAGNIGAGVLKRFSVTFDYAHMTMTLVPGEGYATADVYERSGLFLVNRDGAVVVVGVRPGTPAAEAGIVKGDAIAAVDGAPASELGLDAVRRALAAPASTPVRLDVTSAGGTKKAVTLTLRDYV